MPELPEVETITQALKMHLIGEHFIDITTYKRKLRTALDLVDRPELLNQAIVKIWRRAKYIIIELENKYKIVNHLGMTGSWRIEDKSVERQKHDHAEFLLSSGLYLRYHDPRRFGQLLVIEPSVNLADHKLFNALAPEPLTTDFNIQWLATACRKKKKPIKSLIMDNSKVVGVGNIYASESLFMAGINPKKAAGQISRVKLEVLLRSIKKVLKQAIKAGGSTIKNYTSVNGKEGSFAQQLKVYGNGGNKCKECQKGVIRKISQSGRSTFYCPVCQI